MLTFTTQKHAKFLPLTESEWKKYCAALDADSPEYSLAESSLGGAIGVRHDILARAAAIAHAYHQTCRALHSAMQSDSTLCEDILRPLAHLPLARDRALSEGFFFGIFRADFFLLSSGSAGRRPALKLIEVNSCGGGLMDLFQMRDALPRRYNISMPSHPQASITSKTSITSITSGLSHPSLTLDAYCSALRDSALCVRPDAKTLGFAAVENGNDHYLADYRMIASWFREHSTIEPVLLELTRGKLSLLNDPVIPPPVSCVDNVDVIFCDWFEDLPSLERVERFFREKGIATVPTRADLLFENKNVLSLLQRIPRPRAIRELDWQLLQNALIPSFPLEELPSREAEISSWPGVVLKQDIDCGSENVFLYDFATMSPKEAISAIRMQCSAPQTLSPIPYPPSWTIQQLIPPPHIPLTDESHPWLPTNLRPYKYDLMVYVCFLKGKPHVAFAARGFSREKVDELTEEGLQDGVFGPVVPGVWG